MSARGFRISRLFQARGELGEHFVRSCVEQVMAGRVVDLALAPQFLMISGSV
jgi:hypothetical protein